MAKEDDKEEAAKAEAAKAEEARIAEIANRAAADHVKRAQAKFEAQLKERDERIAQLVSERGEDKKEPAAQQPLSPAQAISPEQSKLRELEARIAERDKKLDEERKERELVEKQRKVDEEVAQTIQALAEVGITGQAQRGAMALLLQDKLIGRDDAGKVAFLVQKDGYVDKVPIADGIRDWVEGAGQMYLPPKGIQGSGNKPSTQTNRKAATKAETVLEAKRALATLFSGGGGQ